MLCFGDLQIYPTHAKADKRRNIRIVESSGKDADEAATLGTKVHATSSVLRGSAECAVFSKVKTGCVCFSGVCVCVR